MEYVIIAAAVAALVLVVHTTLDARTARKVLPVLVVAFLARLAVHLLYLRSGLTDYGGDNYNYETKALKVVEYWQENGIRFVTEDEIPLIAAVTLPCNLFALVIYACGGPAPLACTALVALIACTLCVVMYKFARLAGADERAALRLLAVVAFMPAFLLHTSDMFKDGFNAFLVITCLALAAANMRRFALRNVVMILILLVALWNVRPYMVVMCLPALLVGVANPRRALSARFLAVSAVLLVVATALLAGALHLGPADEVMEDLERGQAENVRRANASQRSGVTFDDGGGPWGALLPKILYTLFSPFPWTSGSVTLQLGKIEMLVAYCLFYCAVRGTLRLWRSDRGMLLFLLAFLVPGTVAYATTMSNIGLIFRQRIPIVLMVGLLAALAWTGEAERRRAERRDPADREPDPGADREAGRAPALGDRGPDSADYERDPARAREEISS
ncbi:hypothetical protein AB0D67_03735 [Streptosporangium sp. NPDC048047]|uniref:hypothetical protein n=1 Tax=Streptosporangium sp. NPDC048047 TaxID=3155748 RepID=UPI003443C4B7